MRRAAVSSVASFLRVAACAVVLSACATLPPGSGQPTPVGPGSSEVTGRIAVTYQPPSSDHPESAFANFDWRQSAAGVDLALLDPLGQTLAHVHSDANGAVLTLRDGREYDGPSPEALTTQVLGYTVPVEGLVAWLWGHPRDPAQVAVTTDADGMRHFVESDWTVTYPDAASAMPLRRINLVYGGPGPAISLRLVVDTRSGA